MTRGLGIKKTILGLDQTTYLVNGNDVLLGRENQGGWEGRGTEIRWKIIDKTCGNLLRKRKMVYYKEKKKSVARY